MNEQLEHRRSKALRGVVAGIVLFCVGPAVGILGNVAGMYQSFETIETSPAPTPTQLAYGVRLALVALGAGTLLAMLGLLIFALSLVAYLRAPSEPRRDARAA